MADAGLNVLVRLDLRDVEKGFTGLGPSRPRTLRRVFTQLKGPMRVDQQEHAKARSGPDGSWAPRAASTMERRKRGGHRSSARPQGRLLTAVAYKATASSVSGISRVSWSAAQAEGARVGRGHRSVLPARQSLWISDQLMDFAARHFVDLFADAWAGH